MIRTNSTLKKIYLNSLQNDYNDNLKTYPTSIKKIYIRKANQQIIQRQVMSLKSISFNANELQTKQNIDKEFKEL